MGFYFRKSIGSGPFRMNFSKSGISYSLGAKGARVNFSNRGTYVNFGSNGLYYRKKISGFGQSNRKNIPQEHYVTNNDFHTITSGELEDITDSDSQDFIDELEEKSSKISYFYWFGLIPLILSGIILTFVFFYTSSKKIDNVKSDVYVKSSAKTFLNIRQDSKKGSRIIGTLKQDEQYKLIDESDPNWYKIDFDGNNGYVAKQFSQKINIDNKTTEYQTQPNLFSQYPELLWVIIFVLVILFTWLLIYLKKIDKNRLLVTINYEIDDSVGEIYKKFVHHFTEIIESDKKWQYLHSRETNDYKYTSGAAHTITRKSLNKISTNKKPSKYFSTNVEVPYLGLINTELFFFPERLIIKRQNHFAGIMYKNINCFSELTRFIETGTVPNDSRVVDTTWRYLNKNGTPDKRFNNNRKIPICEYSVYTFNSISGVNEKISTSKVGALDQFIRFIKAIGTVQQHFRTIDEKTKKDGYLLN